MGWTGRIVVSSSDTYGNIFNITQNGTEIYTLGPTEFYPTNNTNRIGAPAGTIITLTAGATVKVLCPMGENAEIYGSVNGVFAFFLG